MTCTSFARGARRVAVALGLLTTVAAGAARADDVVPAEDQARVPLWRNGLEEVQAADSLPSRKGLYQLLSLPMSTTSETVASIFEDDLGGYNNSVWRLGHWVPDRTGTDKYIEPPTLSTVERGVGYWLITADSVQTVYFDRPAASPDTIELPLIQGPLGVPEWNQLGNPFPFNTAVAGWRVVKRDSLLTLGQAASRTWMDANMRTWDPDNKQYTASGTINRYRGFWAQLTDPDTSLVWTRWLPHDTTGNAGYWSSVRIDSKGNPHISFFFNSQLRYVTRVGNVWRKQIVEIPGTFGNSETAVFSNIELDSLDQPYIAEMEWNPFRPAYTRRLSNGAWTPIELIEPGLNNNGWGIKLKVFHGGPRVAYCDRGSAGGPYIKYAEKTVSGWNVVTAGNMGSVPDQVAHDLGFDVSRTGVPHIATVSRSSPYGLRYFTRVGTNWTTELVDSLPTGSTGLAPSLAVDDNGVPHISYFDAYNIDLKYARKSGSTWTVETVDATGNTGNFSEIMIQPNGQPAIAYLEYSSTGIPNRIRFARRTGAGSWQIETVDDVNVSSGQAYLGATLDNEGNPTITYQGSAGGLQLRLAEKIHGRWRIKIAPVPAPEPAGPELAAKPAGASWAVAITARQGGRAAETMYLGAAEEATCVALRSARAPAPPDGGLLSLSVPRAGEDFVRDFQPPAETMTWEFRTEGGEAPGEQVLDLQGFDLPAGLRLYLRDPDAGTAREVQPGEPVTLAARPRTLELVATTAAGGLPTAAGRTGLLFAYPNPFGAHTGLVFTLAHQSDIRVDVFDVSGRRMRTLERPGAIAGEHVLVWDGHDAHGHAAAAGVYLARYRVGGREGTTRLVKLE
jgi:hypothetical protein